MKAGYNRADLKGLARGLIQKNCLAALFQRSYSSAMTNVILRYSIRGKIFSLFSAVQFDIFTRDGVLSSYVRLAITVGALSSMVSSAPLAYAEFACRGDVVYKWVRTSVEAEPSTAGGGSGGVGGAVQGTPAAQPVPSEEPRTVRLIEVERVGKDEAAAKLLLEGELARQKVRASEACVRQHEALGSCVSTKLAANAHVLNSLGFSARTALEEALTTECRSQQGRCMGVEASAAQCREIAAAAPPAAEDDKKGDAKKGDAKKKK